MSYFLFRLISFLFVFDAASSSSAIVQSSGDFPPNNLLSYLYSPCCTRAGNSRPPARPPAPVQAMAEFVQHAADVSGRGIVGLRVTRKAAASAGGVVVGHNWNAGGTVEHQVTELLGRPRRGRTPAAAVVVAAGELPAVVVAAAAVVAAAPVAAVVVDAAPVVLRCCCLLPSCLRDVSASAHTCRITGKKVFAMCFVAGAPEGYGSSWPCLGCDARATNV